MHFIEKVRGRIKWILKNDPKWTTQNEIFLNNSNPLEDKQCIVNQWLNFINNRQELPCQGSEHFSYLSIILELCNIYKLSVINSTKKPRGVSVELSQVSNEYSNKIKGQHGKKFIVFCTSSDPQLVTLGDLEGLPMAGRLLGYCRKSPYCRMNLNFQNGWSWQVYS